MAGTTHLPEEVPLGNGACRVQALENQAVQLGIRLTPVLFVFGLLGAVRYGQTLLFLHPPRDLSAAASSSLGLVFGFAITLVVPAWWLSLWLTQRCSRTLQTTICLSIVGLSILMTNLAFAHPRAGWIFQEAVKARAPQLDFARNIVSMQQRLGSAGSVAKAADTALRIGLIGSSQINLGVDSDQLSDDLQGAQVTKICLPGMVPLQYAALSQDIALQEFDIVVCWLSEFDFFREQTLPTSRLRWCCDHQNFGELRTMLEPRLLWGNRSDLADLAVATRVTVWQQRELFQMLAFRFWWPFDAVAVKATKEEVQVGARLANRKQGVANARKNIARTALLETNFAAFRNFRKHIMDSNARLIVLEGECHPQTMAAYDPDFRIQTREWMRQLAVDHKFTFVEADQRFAIADSDWSDAVHLNESGRTKLTSFLSALIKHQTSDQASWSSLED
ncbi:MAG: hypothetical protein R3C59_24455 [Planctomycetaceae bacterium]